MQHDKKLSPVEAAHEYLLGLERLCRHLGSNSQQEFITEELLYSQALVRNYLLAWLEDNPPTYWHLAVVGGGGAGKSSVVNILLAQPLAETNPQAGFTRHPTAFCPNGVPQVNFLPKLGRATHPVPGNEDRDIYDLRNISAPDGWPARLIVWDNPDMTTIHAGNYITRLLEVLGLADVVIYVASAQRYNDRVPSQYLALLASSGKPVLVCLTKVPDTQADLIRGDFLNQVAQRLLGLKELPCVIIPEKSLADLQNPLVMAPYRQQMLTVIQQWIDQGKHLRIRLIQAAVKFLRDRESQWTQLLSSDVHALAEWLRLAEEQKNLVVQRYQQDFLERERLPIFDEAMIRLLELLEVPGVGWYLSAVLGVLRLPWRGFKYVLAKLASDYTPGMTTRSERALIFQAIEQALGFLWREVEHRRSTNPIWQRLTDYLSFTSGFPEQVRQRVDELLADYEHSCRECIETIACNIYRDLQKNPLALNALRGTKLTLELGSIGGILLTGGLNVWDLVLIPLAASIIQALTEYLGQQYIEVSRAEAKQKQLKLFEQHLVTPLFNEIVRAPAIQDWWQLEATLRELPGLREIFTKALEQKLAVIA